MPRTQNKLSVVQRDDKRFHEIVAAIDAIGVSELVATGLAGKTSFFKYKNRKPVNPRIERAILAAIIQKGGLMQGDLITLADEAISQAKLNQN